MGRAQRGDRASYELVLRESVPAIRRVARHQGATGEFIDDVVQDVLITVHGARQTFDASRSYMAWLTVITQRRTFDLLRKRRRLGTRELNVPGSYESHAAPDNTLQEYERRTEAMRLRDEVSALPAGQRQAVEKLALQEIALEDASKATGRTKTALKVNLHRGIATLRRRFKDRAMWDRGAPPGDDA